MCQPADRTTKVFPFLSLYNCISGSSRCYCLITNDTFKQPARRFKLAGQQTVEANPEMRPLKTSCTQKGKTQLQPLQWRPSAIVPGTCIIWADLCCVSASQSRRVHVCVCSNTGTRGHKEARVPIVTIHRGLNMLNKQHVFLYIYGLTALFIWLHLLTPEMLLWSQAECAEITTIIISL
jgi:hypothetical protein